MSTCPAAAPVVRVGLDGADVTVHGAPAHCQALLDPAASAWDPVGGRWRIPLTRHDTPARVVALLRALHADGNALHVDDDALHLLEPDPSPVAAASQTRSSGSGGTGAVEGGRRVVLVPGHRDRVAFAWTGTDPDRVALRSAARALPGYRWLASPAAAVVDLTPSAQAYAAEHGFAGRDDLPAAAAALARDRADDARAAAAAENASWAGDSGQDMALRDDLFAFQRAAVTYLLDHAGGRGIVADDMGLGKTRVALAAVETRAAYPVVIGCLAATKQNWRREAQALLPHRRVTVVHGTRPVGPVDVDIVIVNYDVLPAWVDSDRADLRPAAVVFDESHLLKNPAAARTRAARALSRRVAPTGLVLLLTGTPILNRPADIVAQLDLLGRWDLFGDRTAFVRAYRGDQPDPAALAHLNRVLRQRVMIRRRKADVIADLPAKHRVTRHLDLTAAQARSYAAASDQAARRLADLTGGDTAALPAAATSVLATLNRLRALVADVKAPHAVSFARDFLESTGRPLVVFAHHRAVQDRIAADLAAAGIDVTRIAAGMTAHEVEEHKARFQAGESPVIVCSLQAASVGHTLTAAHDVLMVETDWTPAVMEQAEDRVYARVNDLHGATIHYLVVDDTIDETLAAKVEAKRVVAAAFVHGRRDTDAHAALTGSVGLAVAADLLTGTARR